MIVVSNRRLCQKPQIKYDSVVRLAPRYEVRFEIVGSGVIPDPWDGKFREHRTNGLLVIYPHSAEIGINNRTVISAADLQVLADEILKRQKDLARV